MHGKIVSVRGDRGFAFIKPDDGGRDLFAHVTDFLDVRELGEHLRFREVEFDVIQGDDGRPRAVAVRLVEGAPHVR